MKYFLKFDFFWKKLATFCCLPLIGWFCLQTAWRKTTKFQIKKSRQNANGKFDLQHQFILSLQTAVSIMKKKLSKLVLNDAEQKVSRYSDGQTLWKLALYPLKILYFQYINFKILHFQDINRSLSFMRNNERLSDLRFICKDKVSVNVHSELFRQASPFMATLLDITKEKQVRFVNIFDQDKFVRNFIHIL